MKLYNNRKQTTRWKLPLILLMVMALTLTVPGCGKKVKDSGAAEQGQVTAQVAVDTEQQAGTGPQNVTDQQTGSDQQSDTGQQSDQQNGTNQQTESERQEDLSKQTSTENQAGTDQQIGTGQEAGSDQQVDTVQQTESEKQATSQQSDQTKQAQSDKQATTETKSKDTSASASQETEQTKATAISEDGTYTKKDDVALYIHTYGKLPQNFITKKQAKKLGWSGGSLEDYAPGMCIGGDYFGNYEGLLPEDKEYHECDIGTLGKSKRGAKRIIYSDDGYIYYTGDHYKTFELLYEP